VSPTSPRPPGPAIIFGIVRFINRELSRPKPGSSNRAAQLLNALSDILAKPYTAVYGIDQKIQEVLDELQRAGWLRSVASPPQIQQRIREHLSEKLGER